MEKRKVQAGEVKFYLVTVFTCLMAVILVVVIALFIYDSIQKNKVEDAVSVPEVVSFTQEQVDAMLLEENQLASAIATQEVLDKIKNNFIETDSAVFSLRPLFPDDIVLVSNGEYQFIPINKELALNDYVQENIVVLETGELQYLENDTVISTKGIDISKYQGTIDWDKVKADGVEYAFIRLGFRGYGSGDIVLDETYVTNMEGAIAADVKVGVYFFTQAITIEEAIEEADYVLEKVAPYQVDYPIVIDVEKVSDSSGRMNLISVDERTEIVKAFCDRIEESGYTSMIYGNMEMFGALLNYDQLEAYDKWYAYYSDQLYFPYEYKIWQYSESGSVDGIVGDVDLNISFQYLE